MFRTCLLDIWGRSRTYLVLIMLLLYVGMAATYSAGVYELDHAANKQPYQCVVTLLQLLVCAWHTEQERSGTRSRQLLMVRASPTAKSTCQQP